MSRRQMVRLFGYPIVGWALCGATVAIGRAVTTLETALVVHAVAAPLIFGGLAALYFTSFPGAPVARTALIWVGEAIALDLLVVASLVERSLDMFASPLGTWIPFGLIFLAVWAVGRLVVLDAGGTRRTDERAPFLQPPDAADQRQGQTVATRSLGSTATRT